MKRTVLLVSMIFMLIQLQAQNSKTLMGILGNESEEVSTGWFVNPEVRNFYNSDDFNKNNSLLIGGKLGLLLNHSLYIGLSGYAKTNDLQITKEEMNIGIGYGYGGVYFAHSIFHQKLVHPKLAVSMGYGGASEYVINNNYKGANHVAGFVYIEPELSIELNVSQFIKLNFGVTYRYINTSNFELISNGDLDGISINAGVVIGNL